MHVETTAAELERLDKPAKPPRLVGAREIPAEKLQRDLRLQRLELLELAARLSQARVADLRRHAEQDDARAAHDRARLEMATRLAAAESKIAALSEETAHQRSLIAYQSRVIDDQAAELVRGASAHLPPSVPSNEPLASPAVPEQRPSAWSLWIRRLRIRLVYGMAPPHAPGSQLKVSLVTPVLNAVDTIRATLESVLSQRHPNVEIIVIDGGSTDGTLKVLEEYRGRLSVLISEPDGGRYDALGKGFRMASGDVFCCLNAGDTLEPDALTRVTAVFDSPRSPQVLYCDNNVQINGWKFPVKHRPRLNLNSLSNGQAVPCNALFFSGTAYHKIGGVNQRLRSAGDWDFQVRLARAYAFARLPRRLSCSLIVDGRAGGDSQVNADERRALQLELPLRERARRLIGHRWKRAGDLVSLRGAASTPGYAADLGRWLPGPGCSPQGEPVRLRSDLDGERLSNLLFSKLAPDTGSSEIQWLYSRSDRPDEVAAHPRPDENRRLRQRALSLRPVEDACPLSPSAAQSETVYARWRSPRVTLLGCAARVIPAMIQPRSQSSAEALRAANIARALGPVRGSGRVLDVGCAEGEVLDLLRSRGWSTAGCEPVREAAEEARRRGHEVWTLQPDQLTRELAADLSFDAIVLGDAVEHFDDAQAALLRLSLLLRPSGRIILTGPSLGSDQLKLFGPTWSGWHRSYRSSFLSPAGVRRLAVRSQLRLVGLRTWTDLDDTALSLRLNERGIGLQAPLGRRGRSSDARAAKLTALTRALCDWRRHGDNFCAVLQRG